jgi:hypothetical protein
MQSNIPARIHVLMARDASTAVVVRRGPSRHTALIGWDRKTDKFRLGQWLCGRIYERRSDLSPDGKHLIYFAMNGHWKSSVKGSWTAISRAPYLKAVSLFAKGDCWHGGGLFQTSVDYWLNDGYGHEVQENDPSLKRVLEYPWHTTYGGECLGVYFIRLQRDGWSMKHTSLLGDANDSEVTVSDKRINDHWQLRKRAHAASSPRKPGRGTYFDTHELFNIRTEELIVKDSWEWADVDGGRVVWAESGRLVAGHINAKGLQSENVLLDFSPMRFEPLAAPY